MNGIIDTSFDVYSDTPPGKDPDSHSPTLRKYHKILWDKSLPNGQVFSLTDSLASSYLHHESKLGVFPLSSDAITHTYSRVRSMAHITDQVPLPEMKQFFSACSTIGGYIVFPSNKIDGKMTINGSRGLNPFIRDRFDLTLECIKRHYTDESSPLSETLGRYATFFRLFLDFKGYVEFFLLQDLIERDSEKIKFWLPFNGFDRSPLPSGAYEYQSYKKRVTDFVANRNKRMLNSVN